jgi:hypothetical protein
VEWSHARALKMHSRLLLADPCSLRFACTPPTHTLSHTHMRARTHNVYVCVFVFVCLCLCNHIYVLHDQDVYAQSGGKMLPTFQVYRGTKQVRESTGAIKDELEKMIAAECL